MIRWITGFISSSTRIGFRDYSLEEFALYPVIMIAPTIYTLYISYVYRYRYRLIMIDIDIDVDIDR